jgi:hypothetical protein
VSVGLIGQDKLGVTLSCVARTCVTTVHPVHEVAGTVPDGENEDHATLKGFAHDWKAAETLGLSCCGVAVILQRISRIQNEASEAHLLTVVILSRPGHAVLLATALVITLPSCM